MRRTVTVVGALLGLLLPLLLLSPALARSARQAPSSSPLAVAGAARTINPATAAALAAAMDIPAENLLSATIGTSDPIAVGIGTTPLGRFFPRTGGSFAILTTGRATDAETANSSGSLSTVLDGAVNSQQQDLVQLRVVLAPPAGARCLSVDFAFFSEEFPEFVGSSFNDAFIAELGGSTFQIVGNDVVAPNNFAFDTGGNVISVNTVFGVTSNTGQTTYDGSTPLLRAIGRLPDQLPPMIEVVFTIQDLGDSIYDSAVFLDNFMWLFTADCASGAQLLVSAMSPPSGDYARTQLFDLLLFDQVQGRIIGSVSGTLNGVDVSPFLATCRPGIRLDGIGDTRRCPGVSGALLESVFGPGPYTLRLNFVFADGSTGSDAVIWEIPSTPGPPALTLSPPSGTYGATQRFDVVLLVQGTASPVVSGTATVDGFDVTGPLGACLGQTPLEVLPGVGVAFRCAGVRGAAFGPGPRTISVRVTLADGSSLTDSVTWNIIENLELVPGVR
jgi:hypothetical protein